MTPYEQVEEALVDLRAWVLEHAVAVEREMTAERTKPLHKHAAVLRLMQLNNPLSDPNKPARHSASSAVQVVEMDEAFMRTEQQRALLVADVIRASGRVEAAKLAAALALAHYTVTGGGR